MRSLLLLIAIIINSLSSHCFAMQKLIHYLDKSSDPITYITQNDSIKHCQMALRLDPSHPEHLKFERNNEWTSEEGHINKATRRQIALSFEVEGSIFGYDSRWFGLIGTRRERSHHVVEQIMHALEKINGYVSPHISAVLKAYVKQKTKRDKTTVSTLEAFFPQSQIPQSTPKSLEPAQPSNVPQSTSEVQKPSQNVSKPTYKEAITNEAFRDLVLKDNSTLLENANNYLRKNYFDSIGHLTHDKTKIFGEQLLRFDPGHPGNSELWQLDPDMPQHKLHVHKTFERERLLCSLIATAINDDDYETVLTLSPINPQNPKAAISAGYFSPMLKAIIAGFIENKNSELKRDIDTQNIHVLISNLCKCNPPLLLQDCKICSPIPKTPPQEPTSKNPPLNLEGHCNCNPFKILKECNICLAKLQIPINQNTGTVSATVDQTPPAPPKE